MILYLVFRWEQNCLRNILPPSSGYKFEQSWSATILTPKSFSSCTSSLYLWYESQAMSPLLLSAISSGWSCVSVSQIFTPLPKTYNNGYSRFFYLVLSVLKTEINIHIRSSTHQNKGKVSIIYIYIRKQFWNATPMSTGLQYFIFLSVETV